MSSHMFKTAANALLVLVAVCDFDLTRCLVFGEVEFLGDLALSAAQLVITLLTIEQISLAMGRANVVHAGLIQAGATDRVSSEAERVMRYRAGFAAST